MRWAPHGWAPHSWGFAALQLQCMQCATQHGCAHAVPPLHIVPPLNYHGPVAGQMRPGVRHVHALQLRLGLWPKLWQGCGRAVAALCAAAVAALCAVAVAALHVRTVPAAQAPCRPPLL